MFHSIFQGIHWGKLMEGRKKVWPKSSLCVVSKCVCVCWVPVFPHSIGLFSMPTNIFSQTVSGFSLFENCSPYTHTHAHLDENGSWERVSEVSARGCKHSLLALSFWHIWRPTLVAAPCQKIDFAGAWGHERAKKCINQEFNQGKTKCTREERGGVATHSRTLTHTHTWGGKRSCPKAAPSPLSLSLPSPLPRPLPLLFCHPPIRTAWKFSAFKTTIYLTKASAVGHCCCCICFLNKLYTQFRHSRCLEIAVVVVVVFGCCRRW